MAKLKKNPPIELNVMPIKVKKNKGGIIPNIIQNQNKVKILANWLKKLAKELLFIFPWVSLMPNSW